MRAARLADLWRFVAYAALSLAAGAIYATVEVADAIIQSRRPIEQFQQPERQIMQGFSLADRGVLGVEAIAALAGGLRGHVALAHGALDQQPAGDPHQPGGQAHAFGRIGQGRVARQDLAVMTTRSVEIAGGLFDQLHAFFERTVEKLGFRKVLDDPRAPGRRYGCVQIGHRYSMPLRKAARTSRQTAGSATLMPQPIRPVLRPAPSEPDTQTPGDTKPYSLIKVNELLVEATKQRIGRVASGPLLDW